MKRCTYLFAVVALVGTVATARADRASPPPKTVKFGSRDVKLVVEVDDKVKTAKLVIPQGLLTEDKRRSDAGWHLPTIMAGLALTLAFVSGGLWLARRGPARKVAAVVLVLSLLAFGTAALYANAGFKPTPVPKVVTLPADVILSDKLVLEVVDKGDAVHLIVNPSMLAKKPEKSEK
jgi:hypothetical protein